MVKLKKPVQNPLEKNHKITILSAEHCKLFMKEDREEPYIVISINNTGQTTKLSMNKGLEAILLLEIDDIEKETPNCTLMNKVHARDIRKFVDMFKHKVNHIVIHCTAGVSRSAAIGFTLERYLNKDDRHLFESKSYHPNKHIYKTMCKELYLTYNEPKFNKLRDLPITDDKYQIGDIQSDNLKLLYDKKAIIQV